MTQEEHIKFLMDNAVKAVPGAGMQFAVFENNRCIINVCSGYADPQNSVPVTTETLFPIYSCSKVVPATALCRLIDRGIVSPYNKVTDFWEEYGKNGKEETLILHILNHSSGFPQRLREQKSYEDVCNWELMINAIENTPCDWVPGTCGRYQSLSYGWLTAELIQRITKSSFKEYILNELDFGSYNFVFGTDSESEKLITEFRLSENWQKSSSFSVCDPIDELMMQPCIRKMVQPGFNGFASAHALGAFMSDVVNCKFYSRKTLDEATDKKYCPEKVMPETGKFFGFGYALSGNQDNPGKLFGHGGYGGSEVVADKNNNIVCSFTTNILGHFEVKKELFKLFGIVQRDDWA